jgi:hypothetical protein
LAEHLSASTYGLVIAYLIPGFVALWGLSFVSPLVSTWLTGSAGAEPSVGGFLHFTLAHIATGMILSAIRWALVDTLHHATGIRRLEVDDSLLRHRLAAYEWLVGNHFRYHQFCAHMLIALVFVQRMWHGIVSAGFPT